MRKIKVRAWHTIQKKMYSAEELGQDQMTLSADGRGFVNVSGTSFDLSQFAGDTMIPLEWTGLQDKSGQEIYEGDIVRRHVNVAQDWDADGGGYQKDYRNPEWLPITGVVKFTHVGWRLDCSKPVQKPYADGLDSIKKASLSYSNSRSEIIGNIYENRDLLYS